MASTADENISLTNKDQHNEINKCLENGRDIKTKPPNVSTSKSEGLVPPDGGWGWIVAAAAFLVAVSL